MTPPTIVLILGIVLAPALWQYIPKLLELIFKRKIEANKELKEDGIAFRQYLLTENSTLQSQIQLLIESNKELALQFTAVKQELDSTVKMLEEKDKVVSELTNEVHKLRDEIRILNDILKR